MTESARIRFFSTSLPELAQQLRQWGWPAYRAQQVYDWVYGKGVVDPRAMTTLSKQDRTFLAEKVGFREARVVRRQLSADGTIKLLLEWDPGQTAETVMIPDGQRRTACVSSQVGCPVGCKFCASGMGGLKGNLSAGQIVEQVSCLNEALADEGGRISNVVFMGMGEPLANYANVVKAIEILHEPRGLNMSHRRITVSTVGVPQRMRQLADEGLAVNLAISLHAPTEPLRRKLIPWAEHFSLKDILDAARYFFERTGREVTLEYILLSGVNDRPEHARQLVKVCKSLHAGVNVNLIRYNEVEGLEFARPGSHDVVRFQKVLRDGGVNAHVRKSRGRDIDAACGQLRRREEARAAATAGMQRRRYTIQGQVQGVGFRPFVYRLANEHGLSGLIHNSAGGVVIEAQGTAPALDAFETDLRGRAPALAVIAAVAAEATDVVNGEEGFRIEASTDGGGRRADVTVDSAVCAACVGEMLDPRDRRHGYGLINCTDCGPRFSIVRGVPYDRPNTTMAGFVMCERCRAEYESPADRRFHAQPIACHDCGPKLQLVGPDGTPIDEDPISGAAERLLRGQIVAIKGIGGFHLAVRADDEAAVARLRRLKQRDAKPFALMCADVAAARKLIHLSNEGEAALRSPAGPIVLGETVCPLSLRERDRVRGGVPEASLCGEGLSNSYPHPSPLPEGEGAVAAGVGPGNHRLGVMLPYTPIQHQLFSSFIIYHCSFPLVMTSGNISDEPLVIDNAEAVARLGGMCDAILWHDRPIERCVDDSVVIDVGDGPVLPIRRSRGYAPMAIRLPIACDAPGLCVGGELKNTIAVVRGGEAILSQHMGDLTHPLALEYFRKAAADLMELFGVRPAWIAHDLHPLYQSHVYARQLARELGAELIGVQHHHAHAAALLAEHGETGPILAVVCDGVGYGEDGAIWGGELLKVDLGGHERLGHLDPLELPGGDAAVKDTRRCALALLKQAMGDNFAAHPLVEGLVPDATERRMLVEMLRSGVGCVTSTGAGRVFDGVSAILGLCGRNEFEAQAGMALESAASAWERTNSPALSQKWESETADRLTLAPFARYAADCMAGLAGGFVERGGLPSRNETVSSRPSKSDDLVLYLAWLFHEEFCRAWDRAVGETSERTGLRTVGLSGGVMCNERVTRRLTELLTQRGLRVLRHAVVPPNDGGIALGQAAVAMKRRIDRG